MFIKSHFKQIEGNKYMFELLGTEQEMTIDNFINVNEKVLLNKIIDEVPIEIKDGYKDMDFIEDDGYNEKIQYEEKREEIND